MHAKFFNAFYKFYYTSMVFVYCSIHPAVYLLNIKIHYTKSNTRDPVCGEVEELEAAHREERAAYTLHSRRATRCSNLPVMTKVEDYMKC